MAPKRKVNATARKRYSSGRVDDKIPAKSPPVVRLPFWLWLFKHTQGILTAANTVAVLYYRNVHSVYFVANILTTGLMAKGLKMIIKQPRPAGSAVTKTHGMPSTHSSTTMFMGAYLSLTLLSQPSSQTYRHHLILAPVLLALPPMVMYSRIRLGVHTVAQCFVGGLLGLSNALIWSAIWQGWGRHGMGLARSPWVVEADEYVSIALELAREHFEI